MEEETELRNPFPSPPSHYTRYTAHNLRLLSLLKERTVDSALDDNIDQNAILDDQVDIPDWPLQQLEKPRVDWIVQEPDAYYEVYGEKWPVNDKIITLAESGGQQLFPSDPAIDRRPTLRSILRSVLITYSSLTGALLLPPPLNPNIAPEWKRYLDWIDALSQNLMAAANDLRPVQARGHLEAMMKRQLELRREETKAIHDSCTVLDSKLTELRAGVRTMLNVSQLKTSRDTSKLVTIPQDNLHWQKDVLDWAEHA